MKRVVKKKRTWLAVVRIVDSPSYAHSEKFVPKKMLRDSIVIDGCPAGVGLTVCSLRLEQSKPPKPQDGDTVYLCSSSGCRLLLGWPSKFPKFLFCPFCGTRYKGVRK